MNVGNVDQANPVNRVYVGERFLQAARLRPQDDKQSVDFLLAERYTFELGKNWSRNRGIPLNTASEMMKSQLLSLLFLCSLMVVAVGCGDSGPTNVLEGVEKSELEKYEEMLAQEEKDANAEMAAGIEE